MKRFFYQVRSPPSFGYKILNIFSTSVLDRMLDTSFKASSMSRDKEHFEYFKQFMNTLMRNYCCSEKAMFQMFDKDLRAYKTLTQNYKKLEQLNILCIYGDRDWNPREHAEDLKLVIPSLQIEVMSESTHVLYSDNNYVEMCERIMKFCCKNQKKSEESSSSENEVAQESSQNTTDV